MRKLSWKRVATARNLMILATSGALLGMGVLTIVRTPALTPTVRGERLAHEAGCFGCHGPGGLGGQPNPGTAAGYVPALNPGGSILYYVQDPTEIRAWIVGGSPGREAPEAGAAGADGDAEESGLLEMPAYEGHFSDSELDDVVAYVRSMSLPSVPAPPLAAAGLERAKELGCFGCHGQGGRGGLSNPGSFVGVIPPWDGGDFDHLVNGEEELREWILDGVTERFASNPAASFFLDRQAIQMPAYRGRLSDTQLEEIIAYIDWLRDPEAQDEPHWVEGESGALNASTAARGEWLFRTTGCATCHGEEARGGVRNPNAVGGFVPALNDLAEKMNLVEPHEASSVIAALERGDRVESLREDPPFDEFDSFLERYVEVRETIVRGSLAERRVAEERSPPLLMPSWRHRARADGGPISLSDVDAVVAYLLTLQDWGEEVANLEVAPADRRRL